MIKKIFFLILLLINFNNDILSMHSSNSIDLQIKPNLLNLPEEIIQHIIQQLIDVDKLNNIIKKIKNSKNIFQLYSLNVNNFDKELLNNLNDICLTSKDLKNSVQFYINKLRNIFKEKKQEFINKIKEQYAHYDQDKLNIKLKSILNKDMINKSSLKKATKLIIAGADVNLKDKWGFTTLILTVLKGFKDIVSILLNHKDININIQDNILKRTALIWASIEKRNKGIVKLLLNHKDINLNIKDYNDYTALIWAAYSGHKDIVELLLNHKDIDVNVQSISGSTALMLSTRQGYKKIVKLLLNHKDIDVNIKHNWDQTVLMMAIIKGHEDIVKLILNHKDINVNIKNKWNQTALMLALMNGYKNIAELIKAKKDINNTFCLIF